MDYFEFAILIIGTHINTSDSDLVRLVLAVDGDVGWINNNFIRIRGAYRNGDLKLGVGDGLSQADRIEVWHVLVYKD